MRRSLAFVTDSHFSENSRFDECIRVHDWIADDVAARGACGLVHGGDVYHAKSTPTERNAVSAWVRKVAAHMPCLIVRGNHCADGDLLILGRLKAAHPIVVEEACGTHDVGGITVSGVAWPRTEVLAVAAPPRSSLEELSQFASQALRNVLRGLGQVERRPHVLAMHAMVRGARTSTGQPLIGMPLEIGYEDLLLARADFVAIGHVHRGQVFGEPEVPIVYGGSPRRVDYGETEEKGYLLIHFDGDHLAGWERVKTPCAPMLLGLDEWAVSGEHQGWRSGWGEIDPDHVQGAEVRLRYAVDADRRDAAKTSAASFREVLLARGAVDVKIDEQVKPKVRARCPEITAAKTIGDKLVTLWHSRSEILAEDRRARLLARASELNAEDAP